VTQGHNQFQAKNSSIAHTGAGGLRPVDRAEVAGYGGEMKIFVSENIYGGTNASASQSVGWWLGKYVPTKGKNLLKRSPDVGGTRPAI